MIDPAWFLMGLAIPGLLAQAIFVTYCWPLKNPRPGRCASAWALGPGAGFVMGVQSVGGFGSGSGEYRFFMYLLPCIVLVGVIGAMDWLKGKALDGVKIALCLAVPGVVLLGKYTGESAPWSAGVAAAWLAGLCAWMAVSWLGVAKLDQEANGRMNAFVVGLTAAMAGAVVVFTGSMKYGQLIGTLAFAAGAIWGVGWLAARAQASRGFDAVLMPVLLSWLVMAYFFSELAWWQGVVLGSSPLLLWLQQVPFLKKKGIKGQIAVAAVALAPVVVVLVMAAVEFNRELAESGY
jgi:hypothetical protein